MKQFFILLSIAFLFGCKKEYNSIYTYVDPSGKANLKVVHTVVNAVVTPASTSQSSLQVYLGDTKITGANVTYGGGVVPGLEYASVPAGNLTFKAIIPASASNAEIPVVNAPLALTAGKTYTAVITDSLPTASVLLIEENFTPKADSGKYFVRLINATPKPTGSTITDGYDLYAVTDAATVVSNVQYKTASPFTQLFVGTGSRTFAIRKPGSTTNVATPVSISPVAGRMYSIVSYGIEGVTTGLRTTRLTFFTSRFEK